MLKINTNNGIIIDGEYVGLQLTQRRDGTVIYTPESISSGRPYREHKMPYARYSSAHDFPHKVGQTYDPNVTAGVSQLERDVRALLVKLEAEA